MSDFGAKYAWWLQGIPLGYVKAWNESLPLGLVTLFFLYLFQTILTAPQMFFKRHGRKHAMCGFLYLVWIFVGFADLIFPFLPRQLMSTPLAYYLALGLLGTFLTLFAAFEFQHKHVKNSASGTLDEHATVSYGEMIEHAFYQGLNVLHILYIYGVGSLPDCPYYRLFLLLFVTLPWVVRSYFPINKFSDNYTKMDAKSTPWIRFLYRVKKYQYVFYKHFVLHGLNITLALTGEQILSKRYFQIFWLLLNLSYVMEFFLQTLVKRKYMTQQMMLNMQHLLMLAASLSAAAVLRYVSPVLSICSLLMMFINRKQDLFNTMFIACSAAAYLHFAQFSWKPEDFVEINQETFTFTVNQPSFRIRRWSHKEDICDLTQINDSTVASLLASRFEQGLYYTRSKEVLIFVNPYHFHTVPVNTPSIEHITKKALQRLLPRGIDDIELSSKDHVDESRQTIIITGESGAGKTESMKMILSQLLSRTNNRNDCTSNHSQTTQAMQTNLLMEAFGNAKTVRNDNSSRYGKLIKIVFNSDDTTVNSVEVETYLLEKGRVSGRSIKSEGNFHIFHKLVQSLEVPHPQFRYLEMEGGTGDTSESSRNEAVGCVSYSLDDIRTAFSESLSMSANQIQALLSLVEGILHFGQVQFEDTLEGNVSVAQIHHCSNLLGIREELLSSSLTTLFLRDGIEVPCTSRQAYMTVDALACDLYSRLFDYLIRVINSSSSSLGDAHQQQTTCSHVFNILDMFGFEKLAYNGLEQLLINYANEVLHSVFLQQHVTHLQAEYRSEGISGIVKTDLIDSSTVDNKHIIDCLEHPHTGILASLHEQSLLLSYCKVVDSDQNKRFQQTFISKLELNASTKHSAVLSLGKLSRNFIVNHFACPVAYTANEMLLRNCLVNLSRFHNLLAQSSNPIVEQLYAHTISPADECSPETAAAASSMTICKSFKQQIQKLSQVIDPSYSSINYYLKCIKSNDHKTPLLLDMQYVTQQVQYSGLVPAASLDKVCFPHKLSYESFFTAYKLLQVKNTRYSSAFRISNCTDMSNSILSGRDLNLAENTDYALGKTFIFLTDHAVAILSHTHRKMHSGLVRIQSTFRMHRTRRLFRRHRRSSATIQAWFRVWKEKRALNHIKQFSVIKIQTAIRRYLALKFYQAEESLNFSSCRTNYVVDCIHITAICNLPDAGNCATSPILMIKSALQLAKEAAHDAFEECIDHIRKHRADVVIDLLAYALILYVFAIYLHFAN